MILNSGVYKHGTVHSALYPYSYNVGCDYRGSEWSASHTEGTTSLAPLIRALQLFGNVDLVLSTTYYMSNVQDIHVYIAVST